MARLAAAVATLVLSFALAECASEGGVAWERRALGATSSAEPAAPPTPEQGYERLEIDTPFIPLAMSGCVPTCATSLGARLSGVRADMASAMSI